MYVSTYVSVFEILFFESIISNIADRHVTPIFESVISNIADRHITLQQSISQTVMTAIKTTVDQFQTAPVPFTVNAVVTTSDLEFDVRDIDFGYCTVYESVRSVIKLTNKSILPQQFGFVGLPEVSVCGQ